jgi:hypothetical protein
MDFKLKRKMSHPTEVRLDEEIGRFTGDNESSGSEDNVIK